MSPWGRRFLESKPPYVGADSLKKFWKYWNPIWGYYLASYVYLPLKNYLPAGLAVLITFAASGALHDQPLACLAGAGRALLTLWFRYWGWWWLFRRSWRSLCRAELVGRVAMNGGHLAICFVLAVLCRDWLLAVQQDDQPSSACSDLPILSH